MYSADDINNSWKLNRTKNIKSAKMFAIQTRQHGPSAGSLTDIEQTASRV